MVFRGFCGTTRKRYHDSRPELHTPFVGAPNPVRRGCAPCQRSKIATTFVLDKQSEDRNFEATDRAAMERFA